MSALTVRRLLARAEFEACVELEQATWQYGDGELLPWRVFFLAEKLGGHVLGAFDGDMLVGFNLGLPAQRNGMGYIHSQMLAVLPEYRNTGVGRRMKLLQRDIALQRGIQLVEWTYDPLEIKNSFFNLHRLGAISRRYLPDFYGPSSSVLQAGLPTDRLLAEWWIASDRVVRTLQGTPVIVHAEADVQVPADIYDWKRRADPQAKATQTAIREVLLRHFAAGRAVIDYRREAGGAGIFVVGEVPAELSVPHERKQHED